MKILQIIKTSRGATWAFNQAKKLSEMGIEVVTVMPDIDYGYALKYKESGMRVINGDWSLPITRPLSFINRIKEIRSVVRQENPDLIHMHFVTNVLMARIALRKSKVKRLFQVPGPLHTENKLIGWIERRLATDVDFWAGACKKTCQYYLSNGISQEKVFLAYYGIPHGQINVNENEKYFRNEFNIPLDATIVAMVSYFYKPKKYIGQKRGIKGHEDFIDAMRIVIKNNDNIVPVIIGNAWDGSEKYEEQVQQYAKEALNDKVIFTGYRNDVYSIYKEIDLVVHPSHSENLGGAAESLMLAVPTISSDVGGFPDIVIPGKTGCLCKAKNPDDLASRIQWAIDHKEEMIRMAVEGQELVGSLLDLDNTAARIKEVYEKIEEQA